MPISEVLIALIVCPEDKGEMWYVSGESILYNPRIRRKYKIEGNIPVLLIDESVIVDELEHVRISELEYQVTGLG